MNIDRTLFWFKDGAKTLTSYNEDFFSLGNLLNRLLNEVYTGKKIKFINIDFSTNKTYEQFPVLPRGKAYYYGGHLRFYGVFDIGIFRTFSEEEQKQFIWNKCYEYLKDSAKSIKNDNLLKAIEYAYEKGIEDKLNPDYRMVETDLRIKEHLLKGSIWVNFKKDGMYSKFTLEKEGNVLFEMDIDKAKNGVEYFLEMYKSIEVEEETIIIKGRKDVDYLPLKIPLNF